MQLRVVVYFHISVGSFKFAVGSYQIHLLQVCKLPTGNCKHSFRVVVYFHISVGSFKFAVGSYQIHLLHVCQLPTGNCKLFAAINHPSVCIPS
jgi:hypothetical protein